MSQLGCQLDYIWSQLKLKHLLDLHLPQADYQGRQAYLTNCCLWNYGTLWDGYSITSDLVDKYKHVCLCFWHRAPRTKPSLLAGWTNNRLLSLGLPAIPSLSNHLGSHRPDLTLSFILYHFIFCWSDCVQTKLESKRAHWCDPSRLPLTP